MGTLVLSVVIVGVISAGASWVMKVNFTGKEDHKKAVREVAERRITKNLLKLREILGVDLYGRLAISKKYPGQDAIDLVMRNWAPYDEVILHGLEGVYAWEGTFHFGAELGEGLLHNFLKEMERRRDACFAAMAQNPRANPIYLVGETLRTTHDELFRQFVKPVLEKRGT